jgi:hypothetical protein
MQDLGARVTKPVDKRDRRTSGDPRQLNRRQSGRPIAGEDRRSGQDRRSAERRLAYDQAVDAAKAALVSCGIDSPEFARAAQESEQARQRLNETGGTNQSARG